MKDIIIIIPMILIFVTGYFALSSIDKFISANVSEDEQPDLRTEVKIGPSSAQQAEAMPVSTSDGKCSLAMLKATKTALKH